MLQGRQTGCRTIAHSVIVVAQGLKVPEGIAHDAQQVVAEQSAVGACSDKGLVRLILHLCQLLTELGGEDGLIDLTI